MKGWPSCACFVGRRELRTELGLAALSWHHWGARAQVRGTQAAESSLRGMGSLGGVQGRGAPGCTHSGPAPQPALAVELSWALQEAEQQSWLPHT